MSISGKFKRQLTLPDLIFIGLGGGFGSGWLFAASHVAAIAGPAGILSWILGGIAILLLGFVYCELGAALPWAGGVIRYSAFSHGELVGYLLGAITMIGFSSMIAIEVVAARQYAAAWIPGLTQPGSGNPTMLGWLIQFGLLFIFFYFNYVSVKTFARSNNIISIFKYMVPLLVAIVLLVFFFNPHNFRIHGVMPFGFNGVLAAVSAGGIVFAYLGLTPILSIASEVKNPQRTIPIALMLSAAVSTVIYILLQLGLLASIPSHMLIAGWKEVPQQFPLPFRDIALVLGLGWLAFLVVCDAVISPSGTANIYMNATSRVVYGWAKSGTFFKVFSQVEKKSGIPRPALWLAFALSIFWTLPFPSWEKLVGVVSAALVLSYTIAPVTVASLRRNAPDLPRPFFIKGLSVIGPLSFVISALIVYWSGWEIISWLLSVQIAMFVAYILCKRYLPWQDASLKQQIWSSSWLIGFYIMVILLSYIGSFGGIGALSQPWDTLVVAIGSWLIYYWGVYTCLPKAQFTDEDEAID